MSQYDEINQGLKSLDNKFQLPEQEKKEVLTEINQNLDNYQPKKRVKIEWKYYLASIATLIFIVIVAIPFVGNENKELVQSGDPGPNQTQSSSVSEITDDEITIHIMNYTSSHFKNMMVKVYEDNEMIASQGGMYADGSGIGPGDILEFQFFDYEIGEGQVEIEIDIHQPIPGDENGITYKTSKIFLVINDETEYYLKLHDRNGASFYLEEDEKRFEYNINNDFVEMIKEEVDLDITKNQVEGLLGNDYVIDNSQSDRIETWRYELGATRGYTSPDDYYYNLEDFEVMKSGDIQAVIWFHWKEDESLDMYTALYLDNEDGNVYAYFLLSDGREQLEFLQ